MNSLKNCISLFFFVCFISFSCKKQPYKPDFDRADGYVIGKEICNTDISDDYWLIDFSYGIDPPQIGDTVILEGIEYTNVLKVKNLHTDLQRVGVAVTLDYRIISSEKVISSNCSVSNPVTYEAREMFVIAQSEIR